MDSYEVNHRNQVKRVAKRGAYDKETVYRILDSSFMCHVSFVVDGQPFIIPTLYGRDGNTIFLHGATTSRMIKNLQNGFDISLAVTHVDGIVLARSIFHHSANYRSVVVFGKAKLVAEEDKIRALEVISDQVINGRWSEVRPPSAKELKATSVLAIDIEQASAKIREGGPGDDQEDMILDVWAGVIPFKLQAMEPITDELCSKGELPTSVVNFYKSS
ncbi:pyridoxamine 5'-phosphate oxidase family protein [Fulvivirga ligni]|uniref:pyridoxamine 5'-phosphate oxidase family protein n=1 Tax=Fulvivirga ligni TaxID=2904246 RepID=UPI001F30384C|nr:pyridoxamine 5'-phosphate oxidase family protein [Fulvivirga ligni]UII23135.1 pyridoxamine 5'-phosphate oxidase family protein [Fulvivirga ligni]